MRRISRRLLSRMALRAVALFPFFAAGERGEAALRSFQPEGNEEAFFLQSSGDCGTGGSGFGDSGDSGDTGEGGGNTGDTGGSGDSGDYYGC